MMQIYFNRRLSILFSAALISVLILSTVGDEPTRRRHFRKKFVLKKRQISTYENVTFSTPEKVSSASRFSSKKKLEAATKPAPGKRDFQDHNPPNTPAELYKRYDKSIALTTGLALGSMLIFITGRALIRCMAKTTKRQLRKTKRFGKYFPERELPPLHIAQRIAREQGVALPESLLLKITASEANLQRIADPTKSPMAVAAAAISPLFLQQQQKLERERWSPSVELGKSRAADPSPPPTELLGLIQVNIIGATPSITPTSSHKRLPGNLDRQQKQMEIQPQKSLQKKVQLVPPHRKDSKTQHARAQSHAHAHTDTDTKVEMCARPSASVSVSASTVIGPSDGERLKIEAVNNLQNNDVLIYYKQPLVVTTATIELQPLLLHTTTSTISPSTSRSSSRGNLMFSSENSNSNHNQNQACSSNVISRNNSKSNNFYCETGSINSKNSELHTIPPTAESTTDGGIIFSCSNYSNLNHPTSTTT